jgi:hypothetical protein
MATGQNTHKTRYRKKVYRRQVGYVDAIWQMRYCRKLAFDIFQISFRYLSINKCHYEVLNQLEKLEMLGN